MSGLRIAVALGAAVIVAGAVSAWAASGTALGVKPAAEADKAGEVRVLTVGADIFIGDNVTTGPKGQVQIKFSDSTELVVGPNSALLIEDYLLRDDQSAGKLAINALAGTFRFATGEADHDKYVIKTPTGTIGVRGTEFDFTVLGLLTKVILYNGAVALCNFDNKCVSLTDTCDVGTIEPAQSTIVGNMDEIFGKQRNDLRQSFLYARTQMPLLGEFRFEEALGCFNRGLRQPPAPSLIEGQGAGNGDDQDDGCDEFESCSM
jgi:hypothetical protein